jgi:hypothetical protein
MGPLQALGQVINFFVPALLLGLLAPALAKLLWRRELAAVRWARMAAPASVVCSAVGLAGLVAFGEDGKMATYAAMVLACAVTLWWRGFGPGR